MVQNLYRLLYYGYLIRKGLNENYDILEYPSDALMGIYYLPYLDIVEFFLLPDNIVSEDFAGRYMRIK